MQSPVYLARLIGLAAVFAVVPLPVHAQNNTDDDWDHFGLNFRAGFNIGARFSEPSSIPSPNSAAFPPGPGAGTALNHQYNDGFVNVDSSGNQGGQTWNWSYEHPSQISGDNLLMHATGGLEGESGRTTDDPNLGFDFNYVRDLRHDSWGQLGIKIAFGYTHVQIADSDPIGANTEMITDAYPLNTVVPPKAPYTGSFGGPGPLIGSEPISRSASLTPDGVITGNHDLDAALYDLRLGPSVNIPLSRRFSVQAGGGLALGLVDSDFTFNESGAISGSGSNTRASGLAGGYAELGFAYRVTHSLSVFAGGQWEDLGTFQQTAGGRTAYLDFSDMIFFELGLQWRF